MKIATSKEMNYIDKCAIEDFKIPGIILMENAALSVVNVINKYIKNIQNPNIVIVAGKGNNGGDGFAIARHLFQNGIDVIVLFLGDINSVSGDVLTNVNIAKCLEIPIAIVKDEYELIRNFVNIRYIISKAHLVVDAILGTGIVGQTKGVIKKVIKIINENSKYVISVDIPSGIKSDVADIEGEVIKANKTVTFALLKYGLVLYPAREYSGDIVLSDIGLPKQIIESMNIKTNILDRQDAIKLIPKRKPRSNKGTYGKLVVIAGSSQMTGASILVCKAAYKTGVGLVNLVAPEDVINSAKVNITENINTIVPSYDGKVCGESYDTIKDILNKSNAIAVGPGLGQGNKVTEFLEKLISKSRLPIIIDADGLNAISNNVDILKSAKCPIIVTPHPKEMSRLTGIAVDEILCNTIEIAKDFSLKYNVITLLKDTSSIICNSQGEIYINITGNCSMAKAGSGDVLTGIIGGLIAQGVDLFNATVLGAYLHGKAGEKASKKLGIYGVMASDLCNFIAKIMYKL